MKAFVRLFLSVRRKPVFGPDENASRAKRIAEIKWLLAEIAARPNG